MTAQGGREQDLYNDIIPLDAVRAEYDVLKAFLETVAEVYEVADLLAQTHRRLDGNKFEFLTDPCRGSAPSARRIDELMAMSAPELARLTIEGLRSRWSEPLSARAGSATPSRCAPLPNTYFMRDSAAVFRNYVLSPARRPSTYA
ncbi:MAG: hypothetical protein MZV65_15970 [Chromatiales bacterium]|nr:hypothetical protein [Chromatiales bacterium]